MTLAKREIRGKRKKEREWSRPFPRFCRLHRGILAIPEHLAELHGIGVAFGGEEQDRKSTRLNSSHVSISYAVFCLKKKKIAATERQKLQTPTQRSAENACPES